MQMSKEEEGGIWNVLESLHGKKVDEISGRHNVENDSYHEKVNLAICDKLDIQGLNIHWTPVDYAPFPKRQLVYEKD